MGRRELEMGSNREANHETVYLDVVRASNTFEKNTDE